MFTALGRRGAKVDSEGLSVLRDCGVPAVRQHEAVHHVSKASTRSHVLCREAMVPRETCQLREHPVTIYLAGQAGECVKQ